VHVARRDSLHRRHAVRCARHLPRHGASGPGPVAWRRVGLSAPGIRRLRNARTCTAESENAITPITAPSSRPARAAEDTVGPESTCEKRVPRCQVRGPRTFAAGLACTGGLYAPMAAPTGRNASAVGSTGNKWQTPLAILREERANTGACSAFADSTPYCATSDSDTPRRTSGPRRVGSRLRRPDLCRGEGNAEQPAARGHHELAGILG
jgi:hypothetical protein